MASFTPSALTFQSMGSMNLTIARVNGNILSGTDFWTSGITDIRSVVVSPYGASEVVGSMTSVNVTWTAASGVIHVEKHVSSSTSGLTMLVFSGGPSITA